MWGLLGSSTFLERDLETWLLESWAYLMHNLGGLARLRDTPLVLANTDFFPPTDTEGQARARYLFDRVRTLMGLQDWPCELRPYGRARPERMGEFWYLQTTGQPSGTFQAAENRAIISYATDLIGRPRELVAVFAHELSHFRLATLREPAPGGAAAHELTTELAVAFSGFAVFAANAAFDFRHHGDAFSQGWSARRSGYFSERTWAFALAIFLSLKGAPGAASAALKPNIAQLVDAADRYLKRKPSLLQPLRDIA